MNPDLKIPPGLPIAARADEIVEVIRADQVVIIAGETGSGKSTQLPKLCLAAGLGKKGLIGCTQPRRIAATSLAARVAEEMGPAGEGLVGYRVRFRDKTGPATKIKFMTDGIILAEAAGDRRLSAYEAIIVDEAHERSLNIDFLLGILRNLLPRRPELKVIITSATIDTERFSRAFSAPVLKVSGRGFPVEIKYRPPGPDSDGHVAEALTVVADIHAASDPGDILVFMPTEKDIRACVDLFSTEFSGARYRRSATVLPLFGRLAGRDQQRIFKQVRGRKIVVATNVAETSLTVPGIRFVVDTGLARLSVYGARSGTAKLPVLPVSRASADQRAGRCGRVAAGICVRLYGEDDFLARPEFTRPEIQRSNLAEVILRMISLNLGDPAKFPFLDPPSGRALSDGFKQLLELGAIKLANNRRDQARLTRIGRLMARLPLDPKLSRTVIAGRDNGCLAEVMVIAAALAIQDPMIRPAEHEKEADSAHAAFRDPASDFFTLVNIWNKVAGLKSLGQLSRFCRRNFLSFQRVREWQDIHEQIRAIIRGEKGVSPDRERSSFAAVHQALLSGCLRGIGLRKEKNVYQLSRNRRGMIFPGSAIFNRAGAWALAAEVVETGRLYLRTVANIKPEWIEAVAGDLCKRNYHSPHWEKKNGRVMALMNISIFGLPLAVNRRVDYGPIDPAVAREIFITAALVEGDMGRGFGFLDHNLALVAELRGLEDRLRQRDLVVDDQAVFSLYEQRLPDWVRDRDSLYRFIKRGRDKGLRLDRGELLLQSDIRELQEFPAEIVVNEVVFSLEYSFAPGSDEDGLTVVVPVNLVGMVRPGLMEWMVSGMREEKIVAMLKSLPKGKRRALVPIPETAKRIAAGLVPSAVDLTVALARAIGEEFRIEVEPGDFDYHRLSRHLRPRYRLIDEKGKTIAVSREFAAIISRSRTGVARSEDLFSALGAGELKSFRRSRINDQSEIFGTPERVPVSRQGRLAGFLFPVLSVAPDNSFALDLTDDEVAARFANRGAIPWLYASGFNNFKTIKREVKLDRRDWAIYQGLAAVESLEKSIAAFVLSRVFCSEDGVIPDETGFKEISAMVADQGLFRLVSETMAAVRALLAARRATADVIASFAQKSHKGATGIFSGLEKSLHDLVPPDFFDKYDLDLCRYRLRHLKGLAIRAERAYVDPGRDNRRAAIINPFAERLRSLDRRAPAPEAARTILAYELMLDEFRVAVFAQELGTAMPVSAPRLDEKWREVAGLLKG